MSFNQFLKELGTGTSLKDFRHAARLFIDDNYRLSPKYSWLFHVSFDLNLNTQLDRDRILEIGMLVKSVSLPRFSIDNKVMNAYNRPNIVQTKIKYDPVTITFHDDSADVVRSFWYDYMSLYYRDSDYTLAAYKAPYKYEIPQQANDWGYQVAPDRYSTYGQPERMINAIRLYSLHQKKFTEYILINPTITSFQHGQHAASDQGTLEHQMTLSYETVLYSYGYVQAGGNTDFATLHYDRSPSPLTPEGGGTQSILGPGGLVDSIDSVEHQLGQGNLLGAGLTAFRAFSNFKGASLGAMAGAELKQIGTDIFMNGYNPLNRLQIPTLSGALGVGAIGAAATGGGVYGQQSYGAYGPVGASAIAAVAATAASKVASVTGSVVNRLTGRTSESTVMSSNGEYIAGSYSTNNTGSAPVTPTTVYSDGSYSSTNLGTGYTTTTDQYGIRNVTDSSGALVTQYASNGTVYIQKDNATGTYLNSPTTPPTISQEQAVFGSATNMNNSSGLFIPTNQSVS